MSDAVVTVLKFIFWSYDIMRPVVNLFLTLGASSISQIKSTDGTDKILFIFQ